MAVDEDQRATIRKAPTGIAGLDEITFGGLSRGRPTLLCGAAGCGKTVFSLWFLVDGATRAGEPGVFISFEESPEELAENFRSFGWDLEGLRKRKQIAFVHGSEQGPAPAPAYEIGEYDLEGLLIRIEHAVKTVGARRVTLDGMATLFSKLKDQAVLRHELHRLFRWFKEHGLTVVLTGESDGERLTRSGLEEFIADCVIFLSQEVRDRIVTRHLRVVKYRGSSYQSNEHPFLIDAGGISVLPVSHRETDYPVSEERISTGIERLDTMFEGKGYYRGTCILTSGYVGSGKTSMGCAFARAACERGERCLYFAFEETAAQIKRNMKSIGIDLEPFENEGLLRFIPSRASHYGLEMHLLSITRAIDEYKPSVLVVDPISSFLELGSGHDVRAVLIRLADLLRKHHITALFLELTSVPDLYEQTRTAISSVMDTWIILRNVETNGERNRLLQIIKARGIAHSNQVREFKMGVEGITLSDVYVGPEGVLTGAARLALEEREKAEEEVRRQELEDAQDRLAQKRRLLEARMEEMRAEYEIEAREMQAEIRGLEKGISGRGERRRAMAVHRRADSEQEPKG